MSKEDYEKRLIKRICKNDKNVTEVVIDRYFCVNPPDKEIISKRNCERK